MYWFRERIGSREPYRGTFSSGKGGFSSDLGVVGALAAWKASSMLLSDLLPLTRAWKLKGEKKRFHLSWQLIGYLTFMKN